MPAIDSNTGLHQVRHKAKRLFTALGWPLVSYGLFLLVWLLAAKIVGNPVLLPDLTTVAASLWQLLDDNSLARDILASLERVLIGFFLAVILAVPLALAMAYFITLRRLLLPIVTLLRPIPPIAWIPLAILWFGIKNGSSFFITALAAFFPIFLNAFAGGLSVEPHYIHAARFMGAGKADLLLRVFLPAAFPQIWTGLKIGLGQSWMAVVTAELVAAQSGLGYMIQIHRINLDTGAVLVGMVTIGVSGSLMNFALVRIERIVLPWQANHPHKT